MTAKQHQLIAILEMIRIEDFVKTFYGAGRPPEDRKAIARAFVAKAVYNLDSTRQLIERLKVDSQLRRICGWINSQSVPEEWSFSRAFAEFSDSALGARVHETLIKSNYDGQIVGHISRDSSEIEAREKPQKAETEEAAPAIKFPVGRPRKGEQRPLPEPTRLERQENMTLEEMEADLPRVCNVGSKTNSKGFKETPGWRSGGACVWLKTRRGKCTETTEIAPPNFQSISRKGVPPSGRKPHNPRYHR